MKKLIIGCAVVVLAGCSRDPAPLKTYQEYLKQLEENMSMLAVRSDGASRQEAWMLANYYLAQYLHGYPDPNRHEDHLEFKKPGPVKRLRYRLGGPSVDRDDPMTWSWVTSDTDAAWHVTFLASDRTPVAPPIVVDKKTGKTSWEDNPRKRRRPRLPSDFLRKVEAGEKE